MTSRLTIGLDAHMVGGRETGNESYVLGLLNGLSELDGDFDVCVYENGHAMSSRRQHLTPKALVSSSPWIRLGLDLPVRSWRDGLDVLHTTYTAPVWSRCPIVITVHDITFATNPEWFSDRDLRVLSRAVPWSINRAARVITVSDVCRQQIIDRYRVSPDRVIRIYNGPGPGAQRVSSAEARTSLAALGVDPSRPYVLTVGNLQPRKNLVRFVEAFKQVAARCPDLDLLVVGAEHYRAGDVLAAAGDAAGRIKFVGYVSDRQLAACYELARLVAFPTLFEGFGLPAIEGMAHGVPVVCSRAGALPEVCEDAVAYFDPLEVDSISEVVLQATTDEGLRNELIARGHERAKAFDWRVSALETLDVYKAVAGR